VGLKSRANKQGYLMNGTDYARQIIKRYQEGENLNNLISELKSETLKGPQNGSINLSSDVDGEPNIRPWNWLGLFLLYNTKYEDSKTLWEALIQIAEKLANEFYGGIAHVGTPWNNLAVTFDRLGRINEALIAVESALKYDLIIGNPYGNARENYDIIYSKLLSTKLRTKTEVITKNKHGQIDKSEVILSIPTSIKIILCVESLVLFILSTLFLCKSGGTLWYMMSGMIIASILPLFLYRAISIDSHLFGIKSNALNPQGKSPVFD
jgi:hypothetical protein